jgi:hypothetical protein
VTPWVLVETNLLRRRLRCENLIPMGLAVHCAASLADAIEHPQQSCDYRGQPAAKRGADIFNSHPTHRRATLEVDRSADLADSYFVPCS